MPLDDDAPPIPATANAPTHEARNFFALAVHQIVLRVGWTFKTESIIIPAFLDAIGGTSVLRGLLPVLHRFGTSIPPVIYARRLRLSSKKQWPFLVSTIGMGVPFLLLALVCRNGTVEPHAGVSDPSMAVWLPWLFLLLYGLHFVFVGISRLSMNTLQGKLIRANRRGRLFAASTVLGAPLGIIVAWWKLGDWLEQPAGFGWVFAFSGGMFVAAGLAALLIRESPDAARDDGGNGLIDHLRIAWQVLRNDRDFRRLAAVAVLFGTVLMMMPHYQAFARERLGQGAPNLMLWVVLQHAAIILFSLLAGPFADRRGNRAALHFTIFGSAATPLIALGLAMLGPERGGQLFWLVFVPVGLTSVTVRLMTHYVLEIAAPADHPRYVSTFGLCFSLPVMAGGLPIGWLVEVVGFEPVFLGGAAVIGLGGLLTFRLAEPRHVPVESAANGGPEVVV